MPTPSNAARPFVPFIRWANTVRVEAGGRGAWERRLLDHELVYVLEGCGRVVLDGVSHPARPDSLFLVRPGVFHSFCSPDEPQRLLGVHFDFEPRADQETWTQFEAATEPLDRARMREPREIAGWELAARPFLELSGRPRVRRLLEEVVAEYNRFDGQSRFVAGALLLAATGQIEREIQLITEVARHARVGADAVRRVQRAREMLEREIETPPSMEEIAARVGWSGDHLRRMFRAVLDASPLEIQTAARIRRAQELLRYGELRAGEVARRCGFEDASHFARVFKRQTGLAPRVWLAVARGDRHSPS